MPESLENSTERNHVTKTPYGNEDVLSFSDANKKPFQIRAVGISYCDKNYCIVAPHSYITRIEYIIEGKGTVDIDGKRFTVSAGDCYILQQGSSHYYYADDAEPWTKIWMNLSGNLANTVLEKYGLWNTHYIQNYNIYPQLSEIFALSKDFEKSDRQVNDEIFIKFCQMVQKMSEYLFHHQLQAETPLAERVKSMLDINPLYSLNEISGFTFCSKAHIIRLFKEKYHITPYQYAIQNKIAQSKILLRNPEMPINIIASNLLFSSPYHFSYWFKKETGITPTAYRKSQS